MLEEKNKTDGLKKIEFRYGSDVKSAVENLLAYKEQGESVYGTFNGTVLYSDTVTLDSAYLEIVGVTYAEHIATQEKSHQDYLQRKKEYEEKLPTLIANWVDEGKQFITEEQYADWVKMVDVRAHDIYEGYDINAALDIMKLLATNEPIEKAVELIEKQGHSGWSFSIVREIVKYFSVRGEEFVAALNAKNNQ